MSEVLVTLDRGSVRAERVHRRGREPLVSASDAGDGAGWAAVAEHLVRAGAREAVVALGAGWVQVRRVSGIPPVSRRALRSILARQPLRYLRRAARGTLVTDAAWIADTDGTKVALLGGADTQAVEDLVDRLEGAGMRVARVVPAGFERSGVDLTPASIRRRADRHERRRAAVLALVLTLLWMGVGTWRLRQLWTEERRLSERVAELESASRAVLSARRAVQDAERMAATFDSVQSLRAGLASILLNVASALPAEAFVERVVLRADSVHLSGFASAPSAAAASLRGVADLVRPRLLPPQARSGPASEGRTRFEIAAARRGLP
jgi:hypothetical protein